MYLNRPTAYSRWNRRRIVFAGLLATPLIAKGLASLWSVAPESSLSVAAHPNSPLPEDVIVSAHGVCGEHKLFALSKGSRGSLMKAPLCPRCLAAGIEIRFTARRRRFFFNSGPNTYVMRGNQNTLPFQRISSERNNLFVSIANYRDPDLLDLRVNGRPLCPV